MRSPSKTLFTMPAGAQRSAAAPALAQPPSQAARARLAARRGRAKTPAAGQARQGARRRQQGRARAAPSRPVVVAQPARQPLRAASSRSRGRRRWPRRASTSPATTRPSPPVRDFTLSDDDAGCCARRSRTAATASLPKPRPCATGSATPPARKLVDWYIYRAGYGTAAEIKRLPRGQSGLARPQPPDPARRGGAVQQRAASARDIKAFFAGSEPTTGDRPGRAGLGALRRQGRADAPRRWRPRPGRNIDIPASLEAGLPQARRRPADRGRPQAPPRPPAAQRQPLGRRAQRARRHHPAHDAAAVGEREEDGGGAARRVPARQELAAADRQAAGQRRRPTGASPCRRRRRCAGRRRTRRPGRSCWPSRRPPARSSPTAGGRSGAPTPTRRCGSASPRWPTSWCATPARCPSMPPRTQPSWPAGWPAPPQGPQAGARAISRRWPRLADGPLSRARGHYWLGRT